MIYLILLYSIIYILSILLLMVSVKTLWRHTYVCVSMNNDDNDVKVETGDFIGAV